MFDSLGGTKAGDGATTVHGVTANQEGLKHKFHDVLVSQAVKGGLFATYYNAIAKDSARTGAAPAIYSGAYRTKLVPKVEEDIQSAGDLIDALDNNFGIRYHNTPEDYTTPAKAVQESTVDWSGTTTTDRPYPGATDCVVNGEFSVRWTGFIKPSRTDQYTFYAPLHGSSGTGPTKERVQLWIDNSLVIAQWASLATVDPSGTFSFPIADDYYNLVMDYKVDATDALSLIHI